MTPHFQNASCQPLAVVVRMFMEQGEPQAGTGQRLKPLRSRASMYENPASPAVVGNRIEHVGCLSTSTLCSFSRRPISGK